MLWYGFFYFFLFFTTFSLLFLFLFKITYNNFLLKSYFYTSTANLFLNSFLFSSFIVLLAIYSLFDLSFHNNFHFRFNLPFFYVNENFYVFFLLNSFNLNLNLIYVYYFPFIFIFILITTISILFCLTYNLNELTSFMCYCAIILISGSFLFFTDSIILFFLAYELLLIPSFFILYKFAKTRRCVEASYLMFF